MASVPSVAAPYRLGDLLDLHELGLRMLSGPDEARSRRVSGAHAIEIEAPSRWLGEDWVMLTTGLRLRGRKDAQRELVQELARSGAAALGFAEEVVFQRTPPALLAEARRLDFPVFAVPLKTAFRELIQTVNQALLSSEVRRLQRLASLQRYITDSLQAPDPVEAILARLAAVLSVSAAIVRPDGSVERELGSLPHEQVHAELRQRPPATQDISLGDWHVVATPAEAVLEPPVRWLVVGARMPTQLTPLTRPLVDAAGSLLAAMDRFAGAEAEQERAMRRALLEDALRPGARAEARAAAERAAAFGVDLEQPARVVVMAPLEGRGEWSSARARSLAEEFERRLSARRVPCLVSSRRGVAVALVQYALADLRDLATALLADHPDAVAGVGRPVEAFEAVPDSFHDAEMAVSRLRYQPGGALLVYDDFDLGTLWAAEAPLDRMNGKLSEVLAVLDENPALREGLVEWFNNDLDVVRAADALHLHPNSLRYRLTRLETLLGQPLRRPATISALFLALVAEQLDSAGRS
jgi:purine catabolism regulator